MQLQGFYFRQVTERVCQKSSLKHLLSTSKMIKCDILSHTHAHTQKITNQPKKPLLAFCAKNMFYFLLHVLTKQVLTDWTDILPRQYQNRALCSRVSRLAKFSGCFAFWGFFLITFFLFLFSKQPFNGI